MAVLSAVERLERQNVEGILINAGQGSIAHELGYASTAVPLVAVEDEAAPLERSEKMGQTPHDGAPAGA
jgi:hypothetical protein